MFKHKRAGDPIWSNLISGNLRLDNPVLGVLACAAISLLAGQHAAQAVEMRAADVRADEISIAEISAAPKLILAQVDTVTPTTTFSEPSNPSSANGVDAQSGEAQKESEPILDEIISPEPPAEAVSAEGFRYSLAPVQWGGDVSAGLSRQSYKPGTTYSRNVKAANLRASTYVWQPWFAQLRGGLGVVSGKNYTDTQSTNDTSVVGNASLAMFAQSRFPFTASHSVTDSRMNSSALVPGINYISKTSDVRQSYRPQSGLFDSSANYNRSTSTILPVNSQEGRESVSKRYSLQHEQRLPSNATRFGLSYDHNDLTVEGNGDNVVKGMQGNISTLFSNQTLRADVRRNESKFALAGSESLSRGGTLSHTYRPSSQFSLSTLANYDRSEFRNASLTNSDSRFSQANTMMNWQPDAELPLFLTAGGSAFNSTLDTTSTAAVNPRFKSQSRVGNLGASYNATPNLNYALNGSVANTRSGNIENKAKTGSGSVNYRSDVIPLGAAYYNWNANGAVAATSNTALQSNRTTSAGVGHTWAMPKTLPSGASLDYSLGQSLLARDDKLNGRSSSLSNNAGLSWRPVASSTTSGAVSFSVADIRTVGGNNPNQYQVASLSANVLNTASVNSSTTFAASVQWTGNGEGQSTKSANVSAGYQHARAFNVRGLRYSLALSVVQLHFENSVTQIDQLNRRSGATLDQSLTYNIGRAFVRLNTSIAKFTDFESSSIFLLVGRNFGTI